MTEPLNTSGIYYGSANFSAGVAGQQDLLIPAWGYLLAAITLFFIGFLGFFFNLLVLILIWKDKKLWTPLNVILFNLVCSDFLVSILGNPWTFMSAISYRWIFGSTMCVIYGFFMSLLGITSITTLTVLAFERYVMVSQSLKKRYLSHREATIIVVCIWAYSAALTVPPLFGWGKYVSEGANISCSVNWEEQSFNSMSYILYLFAFGLFIPVIVITFSYVSIIYTMKKTNYRMGRVTKVENKVTWMVLAMIITFMIAWSPYAILALIIQFGDASRITPAIAVVPALLAKSSICYNPVIYVGLNAQFKQALMQLTKRKHPKQNSETYALRISWFLPQDADPDKVTPDPDVKEKGSQEDVSQV